MITEEDVRSFKVHPWNVSPPITPDVEPIPHPTHEMRGKYEERVAGIFIRSCRNCGVRLFALTDNGGNKIEQVCSAVSVLS